MDELHIMKTIYASSIVVGIIGIAFSIIFSPYFSLLNIPLIFISILLLSEE